MTGYGKSFTEIVPYGALADPCRGPGMLVPMKSSVPRWGQMRSRHKVR